MRIYPFTVALVVVSVFGIGVACDSDTCAQNSDCPTGYRCNVSLSTCVLMTSDAGTDLGSGDASTGDGGGCSPACSADRECSSTGECLCRAGTHDCDGVCKADDDATACGAACTVCATSAYGSATCNAGACGLECSPQAFTCDGGCCGIIKLARASASSHMCAIDSLNRAWCWGDNSRAQLGTGDFDPTLKPVLVKTIDSPVAELAVGGRSTCALIGPGRLTCWGDNQNGQLGIGSNSFANADSGIPIGMSESVSSFAINLGFACAARAGDLYCWGRNASGQLGDGTTQQSSTPRFVAHDAGMVVLGDGHTCALLSGVAHCWGLNGDRQAAPKGVDTIVLTPRPIGSAEAVGAGSRHTCALTSQVPGCWGSNADLQLGRADPTDSTWGGVSGFASAGRKLALGTRHTCALKAFGAVYCWGGNDKGQKGDGTIGDAGSVPTMVTSLGTSALDVESFGSSVCALQDGGAVWCWGDNAYGQIGDGTTIDRPTPTRIIFEE